MKKTNKRLALRMDVVRLMDLRLVRGGMADESIIYDCPGNTSILRSCFEKRCGPSGIYVCPI